MRAVSAPTASAKVLRIAVVSGGRVIEEMIVDTTVSLGQGERNTVLVADPAAPEQMSLFERTRAGFVLAVPRGATGTLVRGDLRITLEGGARLPLEDLARGKITLFGITVLFQLVPKPAPVERPTLPTAVRERPLDVHDWKTTFIAAFSFLLHFGLIGALYSDWADDVVDDDVRVAQLVQQLAALPTPVVEVGSQTTGVTSTSPTERATPTPGKPSQGTQSPGKAGPQGSPGQISDARAASIEGELRSINQQMLGVLNGGGQSTDAVLSQGNVPTGLIDEAGRSSAGSRPGGPGDLRFGSDSGIVRPGSHVASLLPGDTTARAPIDPIKIAQVKPPPTPILSIPVPSSPEIPDGPVVIGRLQAGFRACYRKALADDPTVKGSVRMTVRVGPNGDVTGVSANGVSGLPGGMISCLTGKLGSASFAPPLGGGATVVVPMRFEPQPN